MWSWPALLITPGIALVNLAMTSALVSPVCDVSPVASILQVVTVVSLVIATALTVWAWLECRHPASAHARDENILRKLCIVLIAVYSSVLFMQVLGTQWMALGIFSSCR